MMFSGASPRTEISIHVVVAAVSWAMCGAPTVAACHRSEAKISGVPKLCSAYVSRPVWSGPALRSCDGVLERAGRGWKLWASFRVV